MLKEGSLLSIVSEDIARKYKIVPLELKDDKLILASSNKNIYTIQDLKIITGKKIILKEHSKEDIDRQIESIYGNKLELDEDYAKRILIKIISRAVEENVSDIHIEPFSEYLNIRFRVDGNLYEAERYTSKLHAMLTTVIKLNSNLDITEKRLPQDGRTDINIGDKLIDIRTSTIPTIYGEKIVLRILNRDDFFKTKEEIGFCKKSIDVIQNIISNKSGLLLITGETGSGKTTTLYSLLKDLNNVKNNIITIEDPVEYKMGGINQIQVNEKIGLTFENGLKSILRQDPDIIMLGEIRDSTTAKIAIRASITGHLVLSTLHTNDAISSLARLKDMGIEPYLLSASLLGIISQKLVRKICKHCKGQDENCTYCNGKGYLGRTIVYEILSIDDEIRECLRDFNQWSEIKKIAVKNNNIIEFDDSYRRVYDF